jgi:hypothetical protein
MRSGPGKARPLRTPVRGFWVVLAVLFLIEAWLWDHLEPIVARVVGIIPWQGVKSALVRLVAKLSPEATLVVSSCRSSCCCRSNSSRSG